jgi:hypothetical protein
MKALLKKRIHPVLGYAFLFGAGVLSLNQTMIVAQPAEPQSPAPVLAQAALSPVYTPADLPTLKAAAKDFAAELVAIKASANALEKQGRMPPPELYDAIGEGEQLIGIINQAATLKDLDGLDAGKKLQAIGKKISDNSRF